MDDGYSTIIDAIMFLAMVSACALILSGAIAGGERQRAVADSSLRSMASSGLASVESGRVDYLEYRILGDRVDAVAESCGIDPGSWLYRDVTKAVLGRGNRHKSAMEMAAEAAACQFTVRMGGEAITLNPLTGEYRSAVERAVDGQVRERLDGRYAYNFTLRWVPFAGVPFEGSVDCGRPVAQEAASASTLVTMPYRTAVTGTGIEEAISPQLYEIENATLEYRAGGPAGVYREQLRASLDGCLKKSSRLMVEEVLGNTLYRVVPPGDVGNPLAMLASFSDNETISAGPVMLNASGDLADTLCDMIVQYSSEPLGGLADHIVEGVSDGSIGPGEERDIIVRWLCTRYNPSAARATLSVWVTADA
jgi:hypothetical protein